MDIPIADQIVQVGHACLEAGFKFRKPNETVNLIVLSVDSEIHLLTSAEKLGVRGIQLFLFHEPDDQMGFTAACTEALNVTYRREFRDFPLWKSSRRVIKT
jgi:hypothetical protein